jgi:phosphopantothenoylcysteine decarboxylase / phosphopantothenate---cysteine ligase
VGRWANGRTGPNFRRRDILFFEDPKKKVLSGKRILVTAGPCREAIDPVRYISNRSSGKMGYALARAARDLGAETTLISGPTDLLPPSSVRFVSVETTDQMAKAVLKHFAKTDCLIMAAAPADFAPERIAPVKIKKDSASLSLKLKPTVDILKQVAKVRRKGQCVVGFALETNNDLANARRKLVEKKLDLIVVNNPTVPGAGFEHDTNTVMLITPGKKRPVSLPLQSKDEIANQVVALVASML